MTDYGHDLLFGTFTTPTAASADAVVALAQLADRSGLDLVTFQDHPYQPRFLDTWILLSYVAARTQTCTSRQMYSPCRSASPQSSLGALPASTF